jgi:ATP synthase protein I
MDTEHTKHHQKLKEKVQASTKKLDKAKKERPTLFAQMAYLGTIGVIFILPVIVGAYVGVWLDNKFKGFSVSWTISLIILGIIIGAINVYLFTKE